MVPTLSPQDRILHIPFWLWLCAQAARGPTINDATLSLVGHVVTVHTGSETVVCKRVQKVVTSIDAVERVHHDRFRSLDAERVAVVRAATSAGATSADAMEESAPVYERVAVEDYVEDPRPFRRTDWDWCREKADSQRYAWTLAPPADRWLWVEGDNGDSSFDSRDVGFLPLACVKDVVVGRLWPSPRSL